MPELVDDAELTRSSVVANNAMNRGRGITSYGRELGLDVASFLRARGPGARWLDLCCGEGHADIEVGRSLPGVEVVGVDLVDYFAGGEPGNVRWVVSSLAELDWAALGKFDLVTCVHGLHYVGDKLGALRSVATVLADGGLFVANFDAASLRDAGGKALGRHGTATLRAAGFTYDGRGRRISRTGGAADVEWRWRYLGADDRVGKNYTGQEAVAGWYARE
ncbi:class I SAM-dependent methyltransferase [Phytomonospora sp. NPDC050363]|uniref:class I SAM-dependent methyltransferase n=1 Tax=Phytomonospora sp. NPDC050363 TaxID=3155642 RepID=UPI0033E9D812